MIKIYSVFWLLLIIPVYSINYYVDINAKGNNDGTSWQDAWTSFTLIDWALIQPGDTIYISGGIYNERIEILSAGGTSVNPIVISNSEDANHNGEVILVSDGIESSGVKILSNINNMAYIDIRGLTLQNFKYGVYIDGQSNGTHDITITNCKMLDCTRAGVYATGFGNQGNIYNITVDGCYIDTPDSDSLQTDCIYFQYTDDITISNNYLLVDNIHKRGHNDLIQVFIGNNGEIFNNVGIHDDGKVRNCQGFFFESVSGTYTVYNNAIHLSNNGKALDGKIKFKTSTAHTIILNNTVYGYSGDLIETSDSSAVILNNILYSEGYDTAGTRHMIRLQNGRGPDAEVDYNCFYDPTGTMNNITPGSIGKHSIEVDPKLVDINIPTMNFKLNADSPCIDTGIDLNSIFRFDKEKILRPIGAGWDMGAYEFYDVLPVELFSFSAVAAGGKVILNWQTITEVNNYGFEVERRKQEAKSETWELLGFVEGHGNSNSPKEYSFVDKSVMGGKYSYRLKQIDTDGKFEYSKEAEVDVGSPGKFELSQNYPNPFNPLTTIKFSLPRSGDVKLKVFNLLGEVVETLVDNFHDAGVYTINFDASALNSGFYVYRLEAGNFVQVRKMMLVK